MEFFRRKRSRSSSPPKAGIPVRRRISCPVAPKSEGGRARDCQDSGLHLAGLLWPKKLQKGPLGALQGLSGGGSHNQPEDKPEEKMGPGEGADGATSGALMPLCRFSSLPWPTSADWKETRQETPPCPAAKIRLSGSAGAPPAPLPMELSPPPPPPPAFPNKRAPYGSLESLLPKTGRMPQLVLEPRVFWRSLGKETREASQQRRESKYVQTQPLYQDYWAKRRGARDQAALVDASLSIAGLLSSSLLSVATHTSSQRDCGFSFWQELPEVKSRGVLGGLTPRQCHLQEAMFEVITSEASYLRSLLVAVLHFQNSAALRGLLTMAELHRLFSNLSQVKDVSERFLLELEEELDQDVLLLGLGEVVLRHCPAFRRVYVPYVTNQMYQEQLMQQLAQENGPFLQELRWLEAHPLCQRQPLKSFLVLPFQRITRLKILLENILKLVPSDSELAKSISAAHRAVGEIVLQCNENVRLREQAEELVRLEKQMDFAKVKPLPLVSPSRCLLREGELWQVQLQGGLLRSRPRLSLKPLHLHLLSDLLLLSRRRKNDGTFVVKDYAWRCHVQAEVFKVKPLGLPDWTFRLTLSQNYTGGITELVLKAESKAQRQEWVSLLAGN